MYIYICLITISNQLFIAYFILEYLMFSLVSVNRAAVYRFHRFLANSLPVTFRFTGRFHDC